MAEKLPSMSPAVQRVNEIVLRRSQACVVGQLGCHELAASGLRVNTMLDDFADGLAVRLVAYLAANTVHREVQTTDRVPVSWWDGFKLAWFPRWALRRWPAKERTIETEVHFIHMCPHLPQFRADQSVHAIWCADPDQLRGFR